MDFAAARRVVAQELARQFADQPESPTVLPYGFDTGTAWAPLIDWAGVLGVYVYLVNKRTGSLTPLSFAEFEPPPRRAGVWP